MENNNKLVVKSNSLIEAKYKLTIREQKIILYLTSQIKKEDEEFKTYTFSIKEFTEMMGLKNPNYNEILDIIEQLQRKVLRIKIDKGKKKGYASVAWLSFAFHSESEGTIDMRFDPFLKPYLLQLKDRFTAYELKNIVELKRSYSIRLYELLKQYESLRERIIDVFELRGLLGIEDKYSSFGNIKQKILEPSKKEIKDKTDICFEYEEIKKGRKVDRVKFIIQKKQYSTKQNEEVLRVNQKYSQTDISLYEHINKKIDKFKPGYSVDLKTIFRWKTLAFDKWGRNQDSEKNLLYLVDQVCRKKEIENPIGYITTVLKLKEDITNKQKRKKKTVRKEMVPNWLNQDTTYLNKKASEKEKAEFERLIEKYKN